MGNYTEPAARTQTQSQRTIIFATSLRAESGNPDGAGTYVSTWYSKLAEAMAWALLKRRLSSNLFGFDSSINHLISSGAPG